MKTRHAHIERTTKETEISIDLVIEGNGSRSIHTPIGFFSHMLDLFSAHGKFDLSIQAKGDTHIDPHHVVEDTGIVLGQTFAQALGEKRGINRYGFFILPMDESLATVAVDFSGRYAFQFHCPCISDTVGDFPTQLVYDFWDSFAQHAKINLHIKTEIGRNDHHQIEAVFKATARALRMACMIDPSSCDDIPSTKGAL